jgi:hypothetical protein
MNNNFSRFSTEKFFFKSVDMSLAAENNLFDSVDAIGAE